jgi:hypothetical protein
VIGVTISYCPPILPNSSSNRIICKYGDLPLRGVNINFCGALALLDQGGALRYDTPLPLVGTHVSLMFCAGGRIDLVVLYRSIHPSGFGGRQSIRLLYAGKAFETLDTASESSDVVQGLRFWFYECWKPQLSRGVMCPRRFVSVV